MAACRIHRFHHCLHTSIRMQSHPHLFPFYSCPCEVFSVFAEILPVRDREPTRERDKIFANGDFHVCERDIHVRERAAFMVGTEQKFSLFSCGTFGPSYSFLISTGSGGTSRPNKDIALQRAGRYEKTSRKKIRGSPAAFSNSSLATRLSAPTYLKSRRQSGRTNAGGLVAASASRATTSLSNTGPGRPR